MPVVKKASNKTQIATVSVSTKVGIEARITDMEFSDGIKINLYGRSGTGKTTLWSTFPAPILALICSGGQQPGELKSIATPENKKRIKQLVIQEPHDIQDAVDLLIAKPDLFKTVVLDHASGLQDLILKGLLGLDAIPVQYSWGLATQQQWGAVGIQVKESLRALLNLPHNVVIVAQERDFNTDGDSSLGLTPYVASALMPSVVG
jgi:hypothetical protein